MYSAIQVAQEILQNYPEYSTESLTCTSYDYVNGIYSFIDGEENKTYTVTVEDVAQTIKILMSKMLDGKRFFQDYWDYNDLGSYDLEVVDMILQFTIFGSVVYG